MIEISGGKVISEPIINEAIKASEVRLLGPKNEQLGVFPIEKAREMAEEAEADLILIAPNAAPPVCRMMDYSKFRYEQTKKEKEMRKNQRTVEMKEIRFTPSIGSNDMNTKSNAARKFLEKGNRVKVTLRYRGREMTHINETKGVLDEFAETLQDIAVVEKNAKLEGRFMSIVLSPKNNK